MRRFLRFVLVVLGICSGCSKTKVLTPSEFTSECVKALQERSPSLKIEVVRDLELRLTGSDGHEFGSFLYNIYDLYRQDPIAKATLIDRVVATALEITTGTHDGVDRTCIVPIIKDRPWLEESRQRSVTLGAEGTPEQVYEDFNQDLIILYGEDSEKNICYFTLKDLEAAKIERRGLRELACENLKRLLPKVELHGSSGSYMITAGGTYEASLLLLDSIWRNEQLDVRGDIVVAIPTRDLLLVTGSEDAEGLAKVKETVRDAYSTSAYRLTPKLFVRRDGRFVEFEDGTGPGAPSITAPPRQ